MIIGVPKEIKIGEFRVAMTPGGTEALRDLGHRVLIQKGAGAHAGFPDSDYRQAGAALVDAKRAWSADLVVKANGNRCHPNIAISDLNRSFSPSCI